MKVQRSSGLFQVKRLFHQFLLSPPVSIVIVHAERPRCLIGRAERSSPNAAWRRAAGAGLDGESAYRAIIPVAAMHSIKWPMSVESNLARFRVQGCCLSQQGLRHLTCGRAGDTNPYHNASCTRLSPDGTRPT